VDVYLGIYIAGAVVATTLYAIAKSYTGEPVQWIDSLLLVIYVATWPLWAVIFIAALISRLVGRARRAF
jgi:hypothetical protein